MKRRKPLEAPGRRRSAIAAGIGAYVDGFEAQTEGRKFGVGGKLPMGGPGLGGRTRRMWVHGWNAGVAIDFLECECNA